MKSFRKRLRRRSSHEEWQPSPYSLRDQTWWRICVGSKATATYLTPAPEGFITRQCRADLHIPLLVEARSLAFAQSILPEILTGLSSSQLILSAQVFCSGFHPPSYSDLVNLSLDDPSEMWIVECLPEESL